MVQRLRLSAILLFASCCLIGCGDSSGVVATDEEMEVYVEEHGDLALDPAAQSELED